MENGRATRSMKRLGLLLVACFIGVPLAVAPVLGQSSFRPLTIGHALKVTQAFGPDDEDCVFVTQSVASADGTMRPRKALICNQ